MMTQRDFRAIAGAVQEAWQDEVDPSVADGTGSYGFVIAMDSVIERLSDALQKENPNFNKGIFKEACRK